MSQPEGFVEENQKHLVCKLNKAIYGLKQASRMWYDKITATLISLNFKKLNCEPCVFVRKINLSLIIIALYVDDLLIFSNDEVQKEKIKRDLMLQFEMQDLGKAKSVLGMRIIQEKGQITLDQSKYIEYVLDRFNMSNCKSIATPLEVNKQWSELKHDKTICDDKLPYQKLIGCLMYVAICSRPDIMHVVSVFSQYNNCYEEKHWQAAKRVLRYLKGTLNCHLTYKKTGKMLKGYVDSDWGGCIADRRSYTGFCFIFGGAAISWESRKQRTVALSTIEAEYMAMSEAAKEAIFLRFLLGEILDQKYCISLLNDNQSAQSLSLNTICNNRTKHIDMRHHFIREKVDSGEINFKYIETEKMVADVLTKALKNSKHTYCVKEMGVI